jgi:hypothetical protein
MPNNHMVGEKELLTLSLKQSGYLIRVVGDVAPSHHPYGIKVQVFLGKLFEAFK